MTAETPDYSVVIPAYNEAVLLPRTLASIQDAMARIQTWTGEIVVVDNNSTDATAQVARQCGATVVFEPLNRIARARNRGAESASGRYLIFVDADTTICSDLLEQALRHLAGECVCGGGARVGTSDPVPGTVRLVLRIWNALSGRLKWAAGSFVYCLREAWQDSGGFHEDYYASEEIHFSRRLKKWGRNRGLGFVIIPLSVDTSMRKFQWYSRRQLLGWAFTLLLCPWLLRSKRHCAVWYRRPPPT